MTYTYRREANRFGITYDLFFGTVRELSTATLPLMTPLQRSLTPNTQSQHARLKEPRKYLLPSFFILFFKSNIFSGN